MAEKQQLDLISDFQKAIGKEKLDPNTTAATWNAFVDTPEDQFVSVFHGLKLKPETKAALWKLRFGKEQQKLKGQRSTPTPPEAGRFALEHAPEIAAMAAVPLTGGMSAIPAAGFVGLMGGAGEAAKQLIKRGLGDKDVPETSTEAAARIAKEGGIQGGAELGLRAIAAPLKAGLGGPLREAARAAENKPILEAAKEYKIPLRSGEIVAGRKGLPARLAQEIGASSLTGRGAAEASQERIRQSAAQAVDSILTKLSPNVTPAITGSAVQDTIKLSNNIFEKTAEDLYQKVDQVLGGLGIQTTETAKEAQAILAEYASGPSAKGVGKHYPASTKIPARVAGYLEDFSAVPPSGVPFSVLQAKRSEMLGLLRDIKGGRVPTESAGQAEQILSRLAKKVTEDMEDQAQAMGIQATKEWKEARQFYKSGKDLMEDPATEKLLKQQNPEDIVKQIRGGSVTLVEKLKKLVIDYPTKYGTPQEKQAAIAAWNNLRQQVVRTNILEAPQGKQFGIRDLMDLKERITDMGADVNRKLFMGDPEGEIMFQNLNRIADVMARVKKLPETNRMGYWAMIRGGALVGGVGLGLTGHVAEGVATIGLEESIPYGISRIIHSPAATSYFVNGLAAMTRGSWRAPAETVVGAVAPRIPAGVSLIGRAFKMAHDADQQKKTAPPPVPLPEVGEQLLEGIH